MGSPLYNLGEKKIRPGVYKRYENVGAAELPEAVYGVFAIPIHAVNGPLATVIKVTQDTLADFLAMVGAGGTEDAISAIFAGGATTVYAYRLGTGGTQASITLSEGLTLTTKYPTTQNFNVTVRAKLGSETQKELVVYTGTTQLEIIEYTTSTTDSDRIAAAVNANSQYLTATSAETPVLVANVTTQALTGGVAPTVTNESYSAAFTAFESYTWNMLVLDTVDTSVQALAQAYIDRIFTAGALGVLAIGEPTTVAFATRAQHAAAFNDDKVIYIGSGYKTADGSSVDGYLAIAKQAGIIGAMTSLESPTHTVVPGAVDTLESLTNSQYETAITSGMLLLSPNDAGQVWFDSGVNTLITPAENQDNGWKKIRRTTTRFEIFNRIDRILAPLIGKVNCDDIGIGDVINAGQSILDAMANEGKIQDGASFGEDPTQTRGSDYAYFVIAADDIDSLEKIYLTYQFRFTAE